MIIAGIGSRRGISQDEVIAALDAALARAGLDRGDIALLAAPAVKGGEAGISEAAATLGLPLVLVPQVQLEAMAHRAQANSDQVVALMRQPSPAESVALAGAGRHGRLLGPRLAVGAVSCALAQRDEAP